MKFTSGKLYRFDGEGWRGLCEDSTNNNYRPTARVTLSSLLVLLEHSEAYQAWDNEVTHLFKFLSDEGVVGFIRISDVWLVEEVTQ